MDLILVPIKPITTNKAWEHVVSRGNIPRVIKYKSDEYKIFEKFIKQHLTGSEFFLKGDESLSFKSVYSTPRIDLDNCFKAFIDVLEVVYDFDDKRIDEIHSRKVKVPKGSESIKFMITPYTCEDPEDFGEPQIFSMQDLMFYVYRVLSIVQDMMLPENVYAYLLREYQNPPSILTETNIKLALLQLCTDKKIQKFEYSNNQNLFTIGV